MECRERERGKRRETSPSLSLPRGEQRWARPETRGPEMGKAREPEGQRTREPENQRTREPDPRPSMATRASSRHHAHQTTPQKGGGDRRSEIKRPENQRTREPDPPTPSDPLNPPSSDTVLVHRGSPSKRHQNHQNHQNGASKPSKHHENVIRTVRTIIRPSEDHQKTIRRPSEGPRTGAAQGAVEARRLQRRR